MRAIELAAGDENQFSDVASRFATAMGFMHLGDLDAARPHVLVLLDLAERRSTPRRLAIDAYWLITYLWCLAGDWNGGRESSGRGLDVSPLNPQILGSRVLLEYSVGESAQGDVYLEKLLEVMRRTDTDHFSAAVRASMAISTINRTADVPGRLEIAKAAAKSALSTEPIVPVAAMYAKSALALMAVQQDDRPAAEEQYAYFLERRGLMIWTVASVDRLLGLLAQTLGNLDESAVHFEDALSFSRKAGYPPELAWTCCDYAGMLKERDGDGDRVKAGSLLDESLSISSELDMRPLMERVQIRLDIPRA